MMICWASLEMVFGDFSQVISVPGAYRDLNFAKNWPKLPILGLFTELCDTVKSRYQYDSAIYFTKSVPKTFFTM